MLSWIEKPGKLLFITKALRVFSYGFMSLVLPFYLRYLNFSLEFIGIVITLSILTGVFFNIFVGIYAERLGRKRSLQIFSLFMLFSSILFLLGDWISIIVASIFGVISVTGTETGPFLSIEQAALTKFSKDERRTLTFSFYNFIGYTFSALGSLFSGLPGLFFNQGISYSILLSIFGINGLLLFYIYSILGDSLEIKNKSIKIKLSPEARKIVLKLSLLFSIDAFGGGFIIQSILSLWFRIRFNIMLGEQSWIFFIGGIITALSFFLAERIARKIGLLNTMVFTHLPSNVFLLLIAFAQTPTLAIILLFLRQSLSQMDVPTRQSYMMAIVKPEERVALSSATNIPRALAQAGSPYLSTYSLALGILSLPFILSGSLKIIYDILIFITFRNIKPPEEIGKGKHS
ncbi:MAG: MFS transporter [Thermoplasmata archaeon]|jgi:MFS family permease|nr:MFS transporter [Thermoplasmatales archaeon]PMP74932.1 MAG: MFS transporter [Aciduliprofundum sp.]HEU12684.1 MFS transporter [Euryarchaeota archaeon]